MNDSLFLGFPLFVWISLLEEKEVEDLICEKASKETFKKAIVISRDLRERGYGLDTLRSKYVQRLRR